MNMLTGHNADRSQDTILVRSKNEMLPQITTLLHQ